MKWISIKDKLPSLAEEVLVFKAIKPKDNNGMALAIFSLKRGSDKEFIFIEKDIFWEILNVTHWMPLPELPVDANKE